MEGKRCLNIFDSAASKGTEARHHLRLSAQKSCTMEQMSLSRYIGTACQELKSRLSLALWLRSTTPRISFLFFSFALLRKTKWITQWSFVSALGFFMDKTAAVERIATAHIVGWRKKVHGSSSFFRKKKQGNYSWHFVSGRRKPIAPRTYKDTYKQHVRESIPL